MFETLHRLYNEGRLSKEGVANAVSKGWISPDQYYEITGEPYSA
ncbi:XkdX family protein [Neobacillus niacini]|nr:XkdX family protein [Neobacillus niacini]MCM3763437.1 XkdX family protein [Neobacillus niacini]